MDSEYVVYVHTAPNGKKYVGITSQDIRRRWRNGAGYKNNEYFTRAILKYGWDNFRHEIVAQGLTQEEAERKERELIADYDSANPQNGYNIDLGGNSTGKRSESTKNKLSKHFKEHPARYWSGKKLSAEHVAHAVANRKTYKGKDSPRSKKILCEGVVFYCARECAEHYGVTVATITGYCNGIKKVPQKWKDRGIHYI